MPTGKADDLPSGVERRWVNSRHAALGSLEIVDGHGLSRRKFDGSRSFGSRHAGSICLYEVKETVGSLSRPRYVDSGL